MLRDINLEIIFFSLLEIKSPRHCSNYPLVRWQLKSVSRETVVFLPSFDTCIRCYFQKIIVYINWSNLMGKNRNLKEWHYYTSQIIFIPTCLQLI